MDLAVSIERQRLPILGDEYDDGRTESMPQFLDDGRFRYLNVTLEILDTHGFNSRKYLPG